MLSLFIPFSLGFLIAFISSIPVGPINMAIVKATLNKGKRSGLLIGIGGLVIEVFYCGVALFGIALLMENKFILPALNLITIPVLITLGIFAIKDRKKLRKTKELKQNAGSDILIGVTLGFSNPGLLFFWLQALAIVQPRGWLGDTFKDMTSFLVGVAVGISLLFYLIASLAQRSGKTMGQRQKARINLLLGMLFIGFGVYLWFHYMDSQGWINLPKVIPG